jgi:hypothetical protein
MRTSLIRTSLFTPILLALLFATAGNALGQFDPSALYQITARHSGKCLDVSGGAAAVNNGVRVIQWDCNGGDNQKWMISSTRDGYYKILAKHSGRALDVFGGVFSVANGVVVEQWDYHDGPNQMWQLVAVGEGYYKIVPRHNLRSCLDIDGGPGARANGAGAQQWEYWGGDNQKFRFTSLSTGPVCPVADPLTSTFTGNGELRTTHPNAPGPFPSNVSLTVEFTGCRTNIVVTNFPAITNSSNTGAGPNTSRLTMTAGGSGSFDSSNGRIVIPLTLNLENSNILFGNSTLPLRLVADGTSAKNADTGIVTLSGTGTFVGGALDGSRGTLTVTGSFSPRPR